jgi:hypothetical protein
VCGHSRHAGDPAAPVQVPRGDPPAAPHEACNTLATQDRSGAIMRGRGTLRACVCDDVLLENAGRLASAAPARPGTAEEEAAAAMSSLTNCSAARARVVRMLVRRTAQVSTPPVFCGGRGTATDSGADSLWGRGCCGSLAADHGGTARPMAVLHLDIVRIRYTEFRLYQARGPSRHEQAEFLGL